MAFIFYDTETTGVDTAFDQILQFAAIKTDNDLNELDRLDIRCRLMPHIVPSPGALRVTGVTPAMLTDPNLPSHYEAICLIRAKLIEWSPVVFIGYNSISFDEELLRQALFQTLHPTYLTNTSGNARADLMRIVQATAIYSPNVLSIPINDKGRQTLRLDQLAPANGFAHDKAHEAAADVEATIHLARIIRQRAPEVWESMMGTCRKADALRLATSEEPYALTEFHYGREHTLPVVHCGSNPDYDAQVGAFDLRNDPAAYLQSSVEDLIDVLNTSPKVIRTIRANAQPIIFPLASLPDDGKTNFRDDDVIAERAAAICADADFCQRVGQAMSLRFADREPAEHLEQRIYDGFPDRADQALMDQFHQTDWHGRRKIAEQLSDRRVREYARRLIYMEAPGVLSDGARAEMDAWIKDRVLTENAAVPWKTVPKALEEVNKLLAKSVNRDVANMTDIKSFIEGLEHRYK